MLEALGKIAEVRPTSRQVDPSHYAFSSYMDKKRWTSVWHQVDEVMSFQPERVLEVGPGLGLFKAVAGVHGVKVETFDIDPELKPDHVGSVLSMPFVDGAFDVVCAFQMLEHLEYADALRAATEMGRVAKRGLVISLPEAPRRYPVQITVPRLGLVTWQVPRLYLRPIPNVFDGQHYWEVGRAGFSISRVATEFSAACSMTLERQYLVPENPRHRFFVFRQGSPRD